MDWSRVEVEAIVADYLQTLELSRRSYTRLLTNLKSYVQHS